jgi:hypothetical protein
VGAAKGAAGVMSVSAAEADHFRRAGHRVSIVGHALDASPGPGLASDRSGLLFVGAVPDDDAPNAEALHWLIREVLPRIAPLEGRPQRLVIAGRLESARLRSLAGPDVVPVGAVASLAPLFDAARVFVAPMLRGAGLPLKAYQAAAHGVPIVATPLVARLLGWEDGRDLLVASDPEAFARACSELGRNAELWTRLRANALARVDAECRRETFDAGLSDALAAASGTPVARAPLVPPLRAPSRSPHVEPARAAPLPDDRVDRAALLETALNAVRHEVRALRASASWRITAPLRALHALLFRGGRRPGG